MGEPTVTITVSRSDYREILDALDVVLSDRCGSTDERREVEEIIERVKGAEENG